ncbi:type VII secretion target [Amycolatopsis sp. NBC_00345]|uniref:type VII secretion target n=1 Tax=Amycolatopsis sp. NBC_00345 TaxID=2975955 RepID=UPI002E274537
MTDKGFEVVPGALRKTQASFVDAAERHIQLINQDLPNFRMSQLDLGLIGKLTGIIPEYNAALDQISQKVTASCSSLTSAAYNLDSAAKAYEAQDEEYYKKFGWLAEKVNEGGIYQPDQKGDH